MTRSTHRSAWLALAARHRQHRLDEQAAGLQAGVARERACDAVLTQAEQALDAAQGAWRQASRAPLLAIDLLSLHGRHASRRRDDLQAARAEAEEARAAADALRTSALQDLAERDAFGDRLASIEQLARADAARRDARAGDESWVLIDPRLPARCDDDHPHGELSRAS